MAEVFLSYAHQDLPRVRPLVKALEAEGYSVWWDRELQPGESFEATIDREIQAAKCILVVWSVHSIASQWVKNEALEGLDRGILAPISLDVIRLPVAFKQHQSANFTNWPETVDSDEYHKLISAVDGIIDPKRPKSRQELSGISHMKRRGRRHFRRRRDYLLPITILVAAISLTAIWQLSLMTVKPIEATPRLTVIPFESSATPDEQFYALSLTREIIQGLGRFDELELVQVSGLWDLDFSSVPKAMLSQESDYVLNGRVSLREDKVTIAVELQDIASDSLLWRGTYFDSVDNIFELQKKLIYGVVGKLNLATNLDSKAGSFAITPNKDAYREYLRGIDLLRRGEQHHISSAIEHFEVAINIDPQFTQAFAAMCRAYLERYRISNGPDEFAKGQKYCQLALNLDEHQSDVQLAQAELYRTSGEIDVARYHYTKLLEMDPRNADANLGLAAIFDLESNYQAAETLYIKATQLRPTYWKAQNQLGSFYFRQGLYFQAIESFLRVTQLTTANATALNNLGAAEFYAGNFEQAYASWRKASEYSTNSAAYSNMGTALYYAQRYEEALRQFETAARMDANDHRLWGNIGDNLRFLAVDRQQALSAYRRAILLAEQNLKVNPTDVRTNSRLAVYYAASGDRAAAERQLDKFRSNNGNDFNVLYDLAVATSLLEDMASSLRYLQLARDAGYPSVLLDSDPQFQDKEVL